MRRPQLQPSAAAQSSTAARGEQGSVPAQHTRQEAPSSYTAALCSESFANISNYLASYLSEAGSRGALPLQPS